MKIVIINNLYKPYVRGGAERVIEIVVEGLEKQKHEVVVVATRPLQVSSIKYQVSSIRTTMFYPWNLISYYNLNKLPIILKPLWHLINIFNIQSYFEIKKILKKEKPDLVMTHNLMGVGFLVSLAVKQLNRSRESSPTALCKHIHTLHDIQLIHPSGLMNVGEEKKVDSFFAKIYQAINKKLFSSANIVISPSEWLMSMYVDRGFFKNSKQVVLHNPTSFSLDYCLSGNDSGDINDNGKFIFLYVGQIEKHKGVNILLDSFAQLKNERFILKIVGDGKALGALTRKRSKRLNRVKFLGRKTQTEVKELMQKANCLIVPSLCYENQPTVIIEAQQVNLPVIGSNIGGIPEMLLEEFLFKAGDVESLKNKIKWIVNNYNNIKNKPKKTHINILIQQYIDKILSL